MRFTADQLSVYVNIFASILLCLSQTKIENYRCRSLKKVENHCLKALNSNLTKSEGCIRTVVYAVGNGRLRVALVSLFACVFANNVYNITKPSK